jgi:hypothetical protein
MVYSRNAKSMGGGGTAAIGNDPNNKNIFGITTGNDGGNGNGFNSLDEVVEVKKDTYQREVKKYLFNLKEETSITARELIDKEFEILENLIKNSKYEKIYFPYDSYDTDLKWGAKIFFAQNNEKQPTSEDYKTYKTNFMKVIDYITNKINELILKLQNDYTIIENGEGANGEEDEEGANGEGANGEGANGEGAAPESAQKAKESKPGILPELIEESVKPRQKKQKKQKKKRPR